MNVKSPTAQELVLRELRSDIVLGVLAPGSQIVQEALAQGYGVSRVPLREALKILEGEGLVTHHPHRGYFVMDLSVEDLVEVYRLRSMLEAEALRASVPQLTDDDLVELRTLLAVVERASGEADLAALTVANRAFHFAIFEHSGMPRLVRVLHQLWDATDVYRAIYFRSESNRARIEGEHRQILEALEARDAERAVVTHEGHRTHSVEALRTQIP
ncbi:MAG: GntR family transcriptional regulator [Candidatus Nanopelagicales bacterium]